MNLLKAITVISLVKQQFAINSKATYSNDKLVITFYTMPLFYLPATPATVRSLIVNCRLPTTQTNLVFYSDIDTCLLEQSNADENRFALAVNIPPTSQSYYCYQHQAEPEIALSSFDPAWIQRVIVYDELGHAILLSLFHTDELNLPIENYSETLAKVFADDTVFEDNEEQLAVVNSSQRQPSVAAVSLFTPQVQAGGNPSHAMAASGSTSSGIDIERISTYATHVALLKTAFSTARHTILLTSYSMEERLFNDANLWVLLPEARRRGVKIYLYSNDQNEVDETIINFLDACTVQGDSAYTHSKILAVDNHWVAIGSFNWLSAVAGNYNPNEEATLIYRGQQCQMLMETIWTYLRFYRNIQFGNDRRVDHFTSNPQNDRAKSYNISNNSSLQYLPTLAAHRVFLQSVLNRSNCRVIICSPFISSAGQFIADINLALLHRAAQQNTKVYFICLANSPHIGQLEQYLAQVNAPQHIFLIRMSNLHQKTILVDDNHTNSLIAEGSFNWLSAARDEDSEYHNHEVTLIVQGEKAKPLIQQFYSTPVGIAVLNRMNAQLLPTNNLPQTIRR